MLPKFTRKQSPRKTIFPRVIDFFLFDRVPNAVQGHDSPEVEIFGMEGIPPEDWQRHCAGLPIVAHKRLKVSEGGLLPLLAAQKASVPDGPDMPHYATTSSTSPLMPPTLPNAPVAPTISSRPVISAAPAASFTPPMPAFYAPPPWMGGAPLPNAASTTLPSPYLVTSFHSPPNLATTSPHPPQPSPEIATSPHQQHNHLTLPLSSMMHRSGSFSIFQPIIIPPSLDPSGKALSGSIILAPDASVSMVLFYFFDYLPYIYLCYCLGRETGFTK